jgi:hypothetical protein
MSNTADMTGGKPIAVWSQYISGVSAVNLPAFYDIHVRKGEVLFFCSIQDTIRGLFLTCQKRPKWHDYRPQNPVNAYPLGLIHIEIAATDTEASSLTVLVNYTYIPTNHKYKTKLVPAVCPYVCFDL